MIDLERVTVSARSSLREALQVIDRNTLQFVLVVDDSGRLVGSLTDGDVRRGILRSVSLDSCVVEAMNVAPFCASEGEDLAPHAHIIRSRGIRYVPIVDADRKLLRLQSTDRANPKSRRENWALLMVGGEGQRLRPLTENCPKPMLNVGGRPILETMIRELVSQGFTRIHLSLNYRGEMIRDYFGDGARWGAQIHYLEEERKLGTAGAVGLLPEAPHEPFLVMNGDLLTKVDFGRLLDFHEKNGAFGTMALREYDFQVPYGVVQLDNGVIRSIDEKPVQKFFVNAGIYVLDPGFHSLISRGESTDMPALFSEAAARKNKVVGYPVREYWLDIGSFGDLERAGRDFETAGF